MPRVRVLKSLVKKLTAVKRSGLGSVEGTANAADSLKRLSTLI